MTFLALALGLSGSFGARAQTVAEPYRPYDQLLGGLGAVGEKNTLVLLGAGTAASLLALTLDRRVEGYFASGRRLGGSERVGEFWGSGIPSLAIASGTLLVGIYRERNHERSAGEAHLEALVVQLIAVNVFKYSVGRERPNARDRLSFPSGHSAAAMTTAASLFEMYGPAWGVPALGLGAFTMVSRMAARQHHLSDMLFGATLGYVFGRSYARYHLGRAALAATRVHVVPIFADRENFRLEMNARF